MRRRRTSTLPAAGGRTRTMRPHAGEETPPDAGGAVLGGGHIDEAEAAVVCGCVEEVGAFALGVKGELGDVALGGLKGVEEVACGIGDGGDEIRHGWPPTVVRGG